jgi:hypothetical protein
MRAAAFTLLAALALVAAGCGGGKSTMTPLELVSQATARTTHATSAKVRMRITATVGPLGPLQIGIDGVVDNATHSGDLTLDMSSLAQLAGGAAGAADDWKGELVLDGSDLSHLVEYVKLPVFSKLVPGGKPWLEIDLDELGKLQGVDIPQLLQSVGTQDPSRALQMLQAIGHVREVGTAQVDGVETTEYAGTIDPRKVIAKLSKTAGLAQIFEGLGSRQIPVEAWIDGDGYVRKLDESFSMQVPKAGRMDLRLETTFSDFGTPVSITVPPADQTTDLVELLKRK